MQAVRWQLAAQCGRACTDPRVCTLWSSSQVGRYHLLTQVCLWGRHLYEKLESCMLMAFGIMHAYVGMCTLPPGRGLWLCGCLGIVCHWRAGASCRSNQLFDVPTLPLVVVYGSSLIETPAGRVALGLSTWQVRGNSEVAGQNKHQCSYLCKQRWLCPLLLASCRPCFGKERDGRHGWL